MMRPNIDAYGLEWFFCDTRSEIIMFAATIEGETLYLYKRLAARDYLLCACEGAFDPRNKKYLRGGELETCHRLANEYIQNKKKVSST